MRVGSDQTVELSTAYRWFVLSTVFKLKAESLEGIKLVTLNLRTLRSNRTKFLPFSICFNSIFFLFQDGVAYQKTCLTRPTSSCKHQSQLNPNLIVRTLTQTKYTNPCYAQAWTREVKTRAKEILGVHLYANNLADIILKVSQAGVLAVLDRVCMECTLTYGF